MLMTANTVGMGVRRTTASGWRFGFHYRFQTGSDVREPGLLQNLRDPNGHVIDNEGRIALLTPQQRGTLFFGTLGRKWSLGWGNPETGLIAELGATSMGDMGRVMGAASAKFAGRADGKAISALVRSQLG